MNQKGFISIILTIIITALLVGGGTYVLVKRQAEKQITKAVQETSKNIQQQTQIQLEVLNKKIEELEKTNKEEVRDEYEGWQTYTNNEYGFSIIFPENWKGYQFEKKNDGIIFGFPEQVDFWSLSIYSHEDWDIINKEPGLKPKYISQNHEYVFAYSTSQDEVPSLQGMLFEVKDIVKTFKFLDDSTSDWQTYTNTQYKFSFNYPKDWNMEGNLLSYTDIEKYEIGGNNAPISFGIYADKYDFDNNIHSFGNKQYHIDNDDRNNPDSVIKINGKSFDKYDLLDGGSYEGDSAGNLVIVVTQDSLLDDQDVRLVFTWEEKPAGKELVGNKKSDFLDIINTIKFE